MSIAAYVCIVWGTFTSRYTTSFYIFFKRLRALAALKKGTADFAGFMYGLKPVRTISRAATVTKSLDKQPSTKGTGLPVP